LYVFPFHLIYNAIYVIPEVNPHVVAIFLYPGNAMLCMLVLLHVYWYCLFLVMGFTLLRKGVHEDIQQKCSDDVVEEEEIPTAAAADKPKNE
ncbi:hypothetical protein BBJ28_00013440, partial [Nothophytophthora sp. Chile5]